MNNTLLRTSLMLCIALLAGVSTFAQSKKERKSPPQEVSANITGTEVTINFGAPKKNDRVIFGELVPYGEVWRTGANEATTITLSGDMKVGGKLVKAGKYALFTIPGEDTWEIILNEVWDQWGAYNYDSSKDVVRFTVGSKKLGDPVEQFTIKISSEGRVEMMWDQTSIEFEIQ